MLARAVFPLPRFCTSTADRERLKFDKQHAAQQAELEKQQRRGRLRLQEQQRIEEKQRNKEQKRIEQKVERKKNKPPEPSTAAPQTTKPVQPDAVQQLENQHNAEKLALKEQRQREEQVLRNRIEVQRKVKPGRIRPEKLKPVKPNKP